MWNLKRNDTNELTYKAEEDSQSQKMNLWLPWGRDSQGVWESHVHTTMFKMDTQQGPVIQHIELCSIQPGWERLLGENGYRYMYAESLHCSPETTTTLIIGYIPEQNKKFDVWKKKKEKRIDIYTLPYIKQMTNENLLYSTGNSTQYSVMTYMGIESEKEWIYVYV